MIGGGVKQDIRTTVTADGLTIITERMPHVRSVSVSVWVKAGSATDSVERMGMAHFIEHMLFKGTERRTAFDIANSIERVGGSLNAFTSRNLTSYYAILLDEHLDLAIDVLSDMLLHSVFPEDEIEREKTVVIEEIHSAEDIPEELIQDTFADKVLNPLPESKPVLGTEDSINALNRNDIIKYIGNVYTPNNIVISIAGNLDHVHVCDSVQKSFQMNGNANTGVNDNIRENISNSLKIIKPISQAHICCGSRIFGFTDARRVSLWLMNAILGEGMSSRLFQGVREKAGLAYSVYSFTELHRHQGIIATYAATDAVNSEKTISMILREFKRLRDEEVDVSILDDAKSQLTGGFYLGLDSPVSRMNRNAKQMIFLDKIIDIDDTVKQINTCTQDNIQETARVTLAENDIMIAMVSP